MQNIDELRRIIEYNPTTGSITRLITTSPRALKGTRGGGGPGNGYRKICVFGKQYLEHHVIWFYMLGRWPTQDIDHKNNIRNDNRWDNLREVSRQHNLENQRKAKSNNKAGFLGVNVAGKRYAASIRINGRKTHLGNYDTPEEAHEVYLKKKKEVHLGYVE